MSSPAAQTTRKIWDLPFCIVTTDPAALVYMRTPRSDEKLTPNNSIQDAISPSYGTFCSLQTHGDNDRDDEISECCWYEPNERGRVQFITELVPVN